LRPEFAVFPEPGAEVGNGHRGLIEIRFEVKGVTEHAARPHLGKNAILGATRAVERLLKALERYKDPVLQNSVCNLAYLRGGLDTGERDQDGRPVIGEQPNKIPDIAEVVLDLRPAVGELRGQTVVDMLREYLHEDGYELQEEQIRLDYGSLLIPPEKLRDFEDIVRDVMGKVEYADIRECGYGEAQMFQEQTGANCVYFGPGPKTEHRVDEHVSVSEMEQVCEVFKRLIEKYCVA